MAVHSRRETSRLEIERIDPVPLVTSNSVDNTTTFGNENQGAQLGQIYAQNNTININSQGKPGNIDNTDYDDYFLFSLAFEEMNLRERQIKDRTPNTCTWLLDNIQYRQWLSKRGLLWITGKPGSGKSTILKFAIDEGNRASPTTRKNSISASFFFNARGAPLQRTALGLYRSLLHQFYKQKREILHNFVSGIIKSGGSKLLNQSLKKDELRLQLRNFILFILETSALDLYIDALDECAEDERGEVRQFILGICYECRTKPHPLGVCLSGRPYPNKIEKPEYRVCVDENNSGDIERCIRYQFDFTNMREVHKESLEETMITRASGVFQWVDLVLPRVVRMNSEGRGIKQMLSEITKTPQELDSLYMRMLEAISSRELQASWCLLRWVSFTIRPLSLDELRYATVFSSQLPHKSIKEYLEREDICEDVDQMERRMTSLSKGLVEARSISGQDDRRVVQFIHQSAAEFMQRSGLEELSRRLAHTKVVVGKQVGYAHFDLSRSCMNYLVMEEALSMADRIILHGTTQDELPFLKYATLYWIEHARKSEQNGLSQEDLVQFFQWPSNHVLIRWIQLHRSFQPSEWFGSGLESMTLLHVAAKNNLSTVIQGIISESNKLGESLSDRQQVFSRKDSSGSTPLHLAAAAGHVEVVKLLLAENPDRETVDRQGRTPLHKAASDGNAEIVELLLNQDADIEASCINDGTPLNKAAGHGHIETVKLLLDRNADVEGGSGSRNTPLISATYNGHADIVKLLLDHKAEIEARDVIDNTALLVAVSKEIVDIVELLLNRQANVEAMNKDCDTALTIAAGRGNAEIVKLVLEKQPNIEATSKNDRSALTVAANKNKSVEVVKLLLDKQAEVDATYDDETALIIASRDKSVGIVKLLLDNQANIEAKNKNGDTALIVAASWGNIDVVKLLLERQANVEARNKNGDTALIVASGNGNVEVIKQLLAAREIQTRDYLVDAGGRGPLHWAARFGHHEAFLFLLDQGFNTNTKDLLGNSLLHYAASGASIDIVRRVLDTVDPKTLKSPAWSPLHWACRIGSVEVVELLMQSGIGESVVTTLDPPNTWHPYAIAFYHQNDKLMTTTDMVPCPELTITDGDGLEYDNLTPLQGYYHAWLQCDGCFHLIFGHRFHCLTCQNIDYCFMCKFTAEVMHPMHDWESSQPQEADVVANVDDEQRSRTDLWKCIPASSSLAQPRRPGGLLQVGLGFRLPNDATMESLEH